LAGEYQKRVRPVEVALARSRSGSSRSPAQGRAAILVDLAAARAIGSSVPLVKRDALALKGFDKPVPVFAAAARSA